VPPGRVEHAQHTKKGPHLQPPAKGRAANTRNAPGCRAGHEVPAAGPKREPHHAAVAQPVAAAHRRPPAAAGGARRDAVDHARTVRRAGRHQPRPAVRRHAQHRRRAAASFFISAAAGPACRLLRRRRALCRRAVRLGRAMGWAVAAVGEGRVDGAGLPVGAA
jgi:hypothetical protein